MRGVRTGVVLVVLLVAAGAVAVPRARAAAVGSTARTDVTHACPVFESAVEGVPAATNPFDPEQIDVQVSFVGPDDVVHRVPAFFFQDERRSLDDTGHEVVTPVGDPGWRVRFTPPRAGRWRWTPTARLDDGTTTDLGERTFTCAPDPIGHGFVRRSPADPYQLAFDDGTPFVAIGENLAWYGQGGTFDDDRWLAELAAHHATWVRVWMPSWSLGLEWLTRDASGAIIDSSLGNYTSRLDRAWRLDHIIDTARRYGIVVQLVLTNPEWADNPYNAANGGPLARPADMFTDATARRLFERRLRYIVARWGGATNLIWELWNEVDLSGGDVAAIVAWHREMGAFLAATDDAEHLRTTSTFAFWDVERPIPTYDALWAAPEIDLVQLHVYGMGVDHAVNFTTLLPRVVAAAATRYGKPVIVGEAGVDWRGPDQTNAADSTGQGVHEMAWAGVFSGSIGTGMTWWWDAVIEPRQQYTRLDGLVAFLDGVDVARERFQAGAATATTSSGTALQVLSRRGTDTTLVWIRNPEDWWRHPDADLVSGATLTGLPAGRWNLTWYDPTTGTRSSTVPVDSQQTTPGIPVPAFRGELALRATRADAPTSTTTLAPLPSSAPPPRRPRGPTPAGHAIVATPIPVAPTFTG